MGVSALDAISHLGQLIPSNRFSRAMAIFCAAIISVGASRESVQVKKSPAINQSFGLKVALTTVLDLPDDSLSNLWVIRRASSTVSAVKETPIEVSVT